jgi:hypothetical protein
MCCAVWIMLYSFRMIYNANLHSMYKYLEIMLGMETSNILTCVWRSVQCIYRDQYSIYTLYIHMRTIYIHIFGFIYKRSCASKNNLRSKSVYKLVKMLAFPNLLRESITSTNSNLLIISDNTSCDVFSYYKLIPRCIYCGLNNLYKYKKVSVQW